jgi:hypothetical protein
MAITGFSKVDLVSCSSTVSGQLENDVAIGVKTDGMSVRLDLSPKVSGVLARLFKIPPKTFVIQLPDIPRLMVGR